MTIKQRRIFYIVLIGLFFILTPLLIFYALGFRYNTDYNKFQKTGALYIRSNPSNATIEIDGKAKSFITPDKILSLLPGEYNLKISKSGYYDWTKKLEVKSYQTTFAEDIYLFSSTQSIDSLAEGGITNFSTSPNRKVFVYVSLKNNSHEIYIYYNSSQKSEYLGKVDNLNQFNSWSFDQTKIIFTTDDQEYGYIDLQKSNAVHFLSEIININFEKIYWDDGNSNILWGLSNHKLYKINLLEGTYELIDSPEILAILPESSGHYFIYQKESDESLYLALAKYKKFSDLSEISALPYNKNYQINKYGDWLFIYNPDQKFLYFLNFNNNTLITYNILKSVNGFSPRSGKLLYWSDFEYGIFDLTTKENKLIERLSDEIYYVFWHPEADYLFVETKNQLKIIELDNRDGKNMYYILEPEEEILKNYSFSSDSKYLLIKTTLNEQPGIFRYKLQ